MVDAAVRVALQILKWAIRLTFVAGGAFALAAILIYASSLILVSLNAGVLADLFAIIQIWLPFNLNVMLTWLMIATTLLILYKLAVMAITWINRFVGIS